jgi:hypothetical protein
VTAPAFTDYQIQSPLTNVGTTAYVTATVAVISGSGYQITGTFTNTSGGTLTYGNVGIEITLNGHTYLITHDQVSGLTGYIVSNLGTVVVTYTITFS